MYKVVRRIIEDALLLEGKFQYKEAELLLLPAIERLEKSHNNALRSEVERLLGRVLYAQHKRDEALCAFLRAFHYAIYCDDSKLKIHALNNLSVVLLQLGYISLAGTCAQSALFAVDSINDEKLQIAIYGNAANALAAAGKVAESEALYLWQIRLIEEHNSYKDATSAFANIAGTYFSLQNIQLAEHWYAEFFRRVDAHKNSRYFVKACLHIARILRIKEQDHEAIPYIYRALEMLENYPNNGDKSRIYSEAGKIFLRQKKYLQAVTLFKIQYIIASEIPDEQIANEALNNLSATLLEADDIEGAMTYLQQIIQKTNATELTSSRAVSFVNLGICCLRSQQYEQADEYFARALHIATSLQNAHLFLHVSTTIETEKNNYIPKADIRS